jgi:hypothetical protein
MPDPWFLTITFRAFYYASIKDPGLVTSYTRYKIVVSLVHSLYVAALEAEKTRLALSTLLE